jgi:putative transposase
MDDQLEYRLRLRAVRWQVQGVAIGTILSRVHRSRAWLTKWRGRYQRFGWRGLHSQSRRPGHSPTACPPWLERHIVSTRRRLERQKVGLVGAAAIRRELQKLGLGHQLPSRSLIQRVLRRRGLTGRSDPLPAAYCPAPHAEVVGVLQAIDWTCRYLAGGFKVYAFHSLNLRTRLCAQTIAPDKRTVTVIGHLLQAWKTLGIPDFLQLDNDGAFCGGYKVPRVFGQVVRLCLYVGIELIFLPVAEPERNGDVEQLNRLWGVAFWERRQFHSLPQVSRASRAFLDWYRTDYGPPVLAGRTPQQAQRSEPRRRLTARQAARLPGELPLSAGRVHFIRQVQPDGTISLLNETWRVGQRRAGQYVWATIITHRHRLEIWYQRSAQHEWRLLKAWAYALPQPVARRQPEFARP